MNPRNKNIPGLRRPSEYERIRITQTWNTGTNASGIRKLQGVLLVFVAVMGALRTVGGAEGINLGAGIVSAFVILLLCSPVLIVWNCQISRINKRTAMLGSGRFILATAEGECAVVNRWNVYYVGFANARFANGTIYKNVEMPYRHAAELQKTCANFPAYVVIIDGEEKPVLIPR